MNFDIQVGKYQGLTSQIIRGDRREERYCHADFAGYVHGEDAFGGGVLERSLGYEWHSSLGCAHPDIGFTVHTYETCPTVHLAAEYCQ